MVAMSEDWYLNMKNSDKWDDDEVFEYCTPRDPAMSLTTFRPDTKWRRNWRERHSLEFFVNFTSPQMGGFFDSDFWRRGVIQNSFHYPAIMHAIVAIGALHEAIMQRAFADARRKAQAIDFALSQCNKAIACLIGAKLERHDDSGLNTTIQDPNLALTTCVLFTCFEAMQGRCDSAVNHAIQGRRMLEAAKSPSGTKISLSEEEDLERISPLVERLAVQATSLMDKAQRPEEDMGDSEMLLPPVDYVFSLDHGHNTLHTALNSVMRYMQGFDPTEPEDRITMRMAEKHRRYASWFDQWERAFTIFLAEHRNTMSDLDVKRACVLKANHLVGTMLASVDQSAVPGAYDVYEPEFKAIVDLSREVLSSFSSPPLPTLGGGTSGTPYLSFSLWVTDPLWMVISRCRNPGIRQAGFTLLSRNPRQEGIWHAGPHLTNNRYMRRAEAGPSLLRETIKGDDMAKGPRSAQPPPASNDTDEDCQTCKAPLMASGDRKTRSEWVDLRAQIQQWTKCRSRQAGLHHWPTGS